jgi:ABC-type multidrug transport system ATPase subunit
MNTLEFRDVSKRYRGSILVLDRVNLAIRPGEVVAVTGGNGSGKSTLLKIMVGLSRPTGGAVSGRPRRVSYVPERFPSHQRMPASSYLIHMGEILGLRAGAARARAGELLRRRDLVGGMNTSLRRLSKGNAQKVAIAQALMVPPQLLVLDEPWSGLDHSAHGILRDLISELAADGSAVVFTDHREAVVEAQASTVYHIAEGRLSARERGAQVPVDLADVGLVPSPRHRAPAEMEWARMPGVLRVDREKSGAVSLQVVGDRCDELLFVAMKAGWSVERVRRRIARPTATPGGERR